MTVLEQRLLAALQPWLEAPAWRVAFSGGLDSTVLLHLLVRLRSTASVPPLSAIHVHHGLQAAADAWPAHCQAFCDELSVPLQVEFVRPDAGPSLERAAREARYGAFERNVGPGEVLLTGQHVDDQAETLLFRLARGAGVRGLAGMPGQRRLGRGWLLRPLLQVSRAELEAYACEQRLTWVEDPSNRDTSLARNFLRHSVFPLLTQRWPRAADNFARTAQHLREAEDLLAELAQQDLALAQAESAFDWLGLPSLEMPPLVALSQARQRNALRHWLSSFATLPSSEHWAGWQTLRDAARDAAPIWRVGGGELRRADGRLWWLVGSWLQRPGPLRDCVNFDVPIALPGNGQVQLRGTRPEGLLSLRYRQGGEVMAVPGRGRRDLKRLLNERAVPAFVRDRLPLLYRDGELLAVANLPGLDGPLSGEWRWHWSPPPGVQGLSC